MKKLHKGILSILFVMTLLFISVVFSGADAISVYEIESNGSYATANTISLGDSITGSISNWQDTDFYKIIAPSDGKIELNFLHSYSEYSKRKYWNVTVYQYTVEGYKELSCQSI